MHHYNISLKCTPSNTYFCTSVLHTDRDIDKNDNNVNDDDKNDDDDDENDDDDDYDYDNNNDDDDNNNETIMKLNKYLDVSRFGL